MLMQLQKIFSGGVENESTLDEIVQFSQAKIHTNWVVLIKHEASKQYDTKIAYRFFDRPTVA